MVFRAGSFPMKHSPYFASLHHAALLLTPNQHLTLTLKMAPTRRAPARESRMVSTTYAARPGKAGTSAQKYAKPSCACEVHDAPQESAPYPSCTEVFSILRETANILVLLKDEPFEKLIFEEGTSIAARIDRACEYRGVDSSVFRPITFLTKQGVKVSIRSTLVSLWSDTSTKACYLSRLPSDADEAWPKSPSTPSGPPQDLQCCEWEGAL